MLDLLDNVFFRTSLFGLGLIFIFVKGVKGKLDLFVLLILVSIFIGEIVTYFFPTNNLFYYSILTSIEFLLFLGIIYEELKWKVVLYLGVPIILMLFLILLFSDFSLITALGFEDKYPQVKPVGVHQFFDFSSIVNLMMIVLSFTWLNNVVNKVELQGRELIRRYIYIFAFLAFYGGSFFVVAFARLASPESMKWVEVWDALYLPIYILYVLTLIFNLLWKSTTSS